MFKNFFKKNPDFSWKDFVNNNETMCKNNNLNNEKKVVLFLIKNKIYQRKFKKEEQLKEEQLKEEKKQKVPERTEKEFLNEGTRFIELAKEFSLGVNDCRGYFIGLANGFVGAKTLRGKFGMSKTIKELEKHFNDFFSN